MSSSTPDTPHVQNLRTMRRLVWRFRPVWRGASLVFALLLLRSGLEIAYPLVVAACVDKVAGVQAGVSALPGGYTLLLALFAGIVIVRAAAFYVSGVISARVGMDVENGLRAELFQRLMRLRFTYHDKNRSGATIVRALRDMEKTRHFYREVWFGYVELTLLLIAVTIASFAAHWSYGLLVLGVFGTGMVGSLGIGRGVSRRDRGVSEAYDEVTTALQENVAGARVVRAFGREAQEMQRFGKRMDSLRGSWMDLERYWTGALVPLHHMFGIAVPVVLAIGAWRIASGAGTLGEVTAVLLYCRTIGHRMRPLTRLVLVGQQATASASRVFEVLDETNTLDAPAQPRSLPAQGGALSIRGVRFAYAGCDEVLADVSLEVPAGTSLGLIGPTGSGKSTLVQLLPRYYDPDAGQILLDGIDVRDLDPHALREAIGLVFQEAFLFSGTVEENVAYGRPGISRAEVLHCLELAAAADFVSELPKGLDTVVGERGVSLSGGQRQRLTIARALALDPRVLIFDDATASVDAVTEKRLFDGIRAAARGRTTLVISQRVTSVRWCDRIAVLEAGRVAALGTHAELLKSSPLYREIHSHQRLTGVMP
ncbi:MAG: ABC transporter ATP-binding protein [Planctomycetota bacterium]|nr:ABC transporter ATP-binding protein [Planctomycetota bacterium]